MGRELLPEIKIDIPALRPVKPAVKNPWKLKINVTKTDIRYGEVDDSSNCPVARAIKRALRARGQGALNLRLFVDMDGVEVVDSDGSNRPGWHRVRSRRFPKGVSQRIDTYDTIGRMEQFSFPLDLSRWFK